MKLSWWKILTVILLIYSVISGLIVEVPRLAILNETIRNLFFHVPMWFSMMILLIISLIYSIKHLSTFELKSDDIAVESARIAMVFGVLGLITGMIWAKYTWGAWWVNDVQLNGAAGTMLIYSAYFLLRGTIDDESKRARISSVYSIFAFTMMVVFIIVLPRMSDSLHPGKGGNPGFGAYDLDNSLRLIFYPAVIGWTLLGVWIMTIKLRIRKFENYISDEIQ